MPRTIIYSRRSYLAGSLILPASAHRRAVVVMLDATDDRQQLCIGQSKPLSQTDLVVHSQACPMYLTLEHHGQVVQQAWYAPSDAPTLPLIIWEILDD